MKREIPILLVLITGVLMVIQDFVPHPASEWLLSYATDFVIVIGILALPIGIWSMVQTTTRKAIFGWRAGRARGTEERGGTGEGDGAASGSAGAGEGGRSEWFYAVVTLAGFAIMVLTGLSREAKDDPAGLHRLLFDNVLTPAQASLFAMLAFFIASAAYRAFRVRTLLAAILLVTAFVVMLRIVPLPDPLGSWNGDLVRWILAVPNLAAKRAIIIGVALGAVAYSIKILLGIERAYMGRE